MKLWTVLTIIAVIASALTVLFVINTESDSSSAEVTESGWCGPNANYYIYSDGTLEIGGSGAMFNYDGLTRAPWYEHLDDITKIVIGDDITQLGLWAFVGLKYVTELTMPITLDSVVSDTTSAFAGCYRIEKINFTCGNGGYGFDYADYQGNNCWYQDTPWYQSRSVLKEINFADGITHIGNDAFRELNITSLTIPDSVTSLGNHCFFNCDKLTELTFPISLNSYGNKTYPAFQGCVAVNKVTFTSGSGSPFDYSTFWGGTYVELTPWNLNGNITKTIIVSDDVSRLGDYMFYNCNIKDLTLPINCIYGRDSHYAFKTPYDSLENVTITKGTGVGYDYEQWYADSSIPWSGTNSLKSIVVEEGVTRIGSYAFYHCHVDTLVLPNSLNILGAYTFSYNMIKNLTIPISLNSVWLDKYPAFYYLYGIEKITFLPGTGYGYNYGAYEDINCWYQHTPWYECRSTLKEIVFTDGIKSIGSDAFRELYITSLVIPDSVESLGNHTFFQCEKLTDLTLPITLDSIYSEKYPAFEGCNAVSSLKFTAGTDGVGFDYENNAPFWCDPSHHVNHISFDYGISYIGLQTLTGYTFVGPDGEILQPTAECLSGLSFTKAGDGTYLVDQVYGENQDAPVSCCFAELDRISAVGSVIKEGRY